MAGELNRVINTTIHEYIRVEEENILRDRKVLAMMRSRGRITFSHHGDLMDWKVRYKRNQMRVFVPNDTLTFAPVNKHKTAQLPYRGYAATDSITILERLQNQGTEAIVKTVSNITKDLMSDMDENFGNELYVDGNASGNEGRIHGFESWFGNSGAAAAGFIGTPSDTYATLSTVLGNYGGSWSTSGGNVNWPDGTGDPEYDFWSPLIVDYTDTAWSASTKTWANTCEEAIGYMISKSMKNRSKKGELDMVLLERELFRLYKEKQRGKERITVERGEQGGLISLGFRDVVNQDGVDIATEYGVPTAVGYGLAVNHLELCSMQPTLFVPRVPDFDIASYTDRYSIDFFGNHRGNPRYQGKFMSIT